MMGKSTMNRASYHVMKTLLLFTIAGLSLGLTSCADLFSSTTKKSDFQRGIDAGRAQVIRQRYWEEQNKPIAPPITLEKRYTPIVVLEYTTPGGVIIEAHKEIVETVH